MGPLLLLLALSLLLAPVSSAAYAYSSCNSSSSRNPANLACTACPSNQIANLYQAIPISCQCSAGHALSSNPNSNACTAAFSSACSTSNSYYPVYTLAGTAASGTANCLACGSSAYSNGYAC